MTKLNAVNIGQNKFCGPAVLSILTGKSTDECANAISSINGQYRIEGVQLVHLLRAADKLGFDNTPYVSGGSLFGTLVNLVNDDGIYIVAVTNHFVCIEVADKKIFFCDNHTKEPMPAASSARMMQNVLAVYKVFKRREPVQISNRYIVEKQMGAVLHVNVYKEIKYDMEKYNEKKFIVTLYFPKEKFSEFLEELKNSQIKEIK